MYNEIIMKRFSNPVNAGRMTNHSARGDARQGVHGDQVRIFLGVNDQGVVDRAKFKAFGCVVVIAAADVACDLVIGSVIDKAGMITTFDIANVLGDIPADKVGCVNVVLQALSSAVTDYNKRNARK